MEDSQIVVNLILFTGSEQGKAPGKEFSLRRILGSPAIQPVLHGNSVFETLSAYIFELWGRIICHPKRFSRAALALNSNRSNRRNNLDVLHNCEES